MEIGKHTTQTVVKRNGQLFKNVSSPENSGTKVQITNIVVDNGVFKASTDNGASFTDVTVKTAQNAQGAYIKPSTGIPESDLAQAVQTSLGKADTAYQKPSGGIPESDLASAVQTSLGKADTAYQKPSGGIPKTDLASAVQTSLNKADTALQSVPLATSSAVGGVKPASKTTEMTQPVGVDSNGALWTAPASGGGGITNAEVIEYAEQLPTASETSPNFVQTPDGTLYRKKAVEGSGLLGTWVINETNDGIATNKAYNVSFTSNGNSYTSMSGRTGFFPGDSGIRYNDSTVYTQTGGWDNENFRTINITDISSLTNVDEFTQWLTANATGGGASVSYEYVAMQEVPTPTTADNGKVLGVTDGAYAFQEASGGGGGITITLDSSVDTMTYIAKDGTTKTASGGAIVTDVSIISDVTPSFALVGDRGVKGVNFLCITSDGSLKYTNSTTLANISVTYTDLIPLNSGTISIERDFGSGGGN